MMMDHQAMAERLRHRIAELHEYVPDSVGDRFSFALESWGEDGYIFTCKTQSWMRNPAGTLHGGMCAALLDQAMGFVVYCIKPGEGIAPTIQMQTTYHRPLPARGEVRVTVRVQSQTRSLMNLTAEAATADAPERLCVSAAATYFYKPLAT